MSHNLKDRNQGSMYLENENFTILRIQSTNITLSGRKLTNRQNLTKPKIMSLKI